MKNKVSAAPKNKFEGLVARVLTICGSIALFASFMLSIEEFIHLKHPTATLNCDLNPLIGCGSILDTWQGHALFGIPNQFFGIAAFSVLVTLGVLVLVKVRLPRWIWQALQAGMLAALLSVVWFMYQSLAVLNHLCPYCMVTWASTLVIVWYVTVYNLAQQHIKLPESFKKAGEFVVRHHADILISVFVVIILGVIFRFRAFFFG